MGIEGKTGAQGREWDKGGIITGQLEWGLTADTWLGIEGEGGKTIELFKDSEVGLGGNNGLKATEVLVMLVKTADDQFGDIVGGGDGKTANGIGEFGPVTLEEVEDDDGSGAGKGIGGLELKDVLIAGEGFLIGRGVKDGVDL